MKIRVKKNPENFRGREDLHNPPGTEILRGLSLKQKPWVFAWVKGYFL